MTENVVRGPAARSLTEPPPLWAQRLNALWITQLKRLSQATPQEDGV
ncbi:hypothetical protein [Streptomyces sp. 351MFTsu5.1]|nr:hypothetical protein [Streptomyces sp. 351MFTsu5.1]